MREISNELNGGNCEVVKSRTAKIRQGNDISLLNLSVIRILSDLKHWLPSLSAGEKYSTHVKTLF